MLLKNPKSDLDLDLEFVKNWIGAKLKKRIMISYASRCCKSSVKHVF